MKNIGSPRVRQELLSGAISTPFSVFSILIAAISVQDQLVLKGNSPSAGLANPLNPAIADAISGYLKHCYILVVGSHLGCLMKVRVDNNLHKTLHVLLHNCFLFLIAKFS
jgi:hypothetical protein